MSDHHKIGAKVFKAFAKKLKLSNKDISMVAQKEDIYNPKTVAKFAGLFPSKLELDMILLLTYADTNGVGNNIYNEFTARLFKILYTNAHYFREK